MISYIVPTRDRPSELARTLGRIAHIAEHDPSHAAHEPAEVVIVDNGSRFTPTPPRTLANGVRVKLILLDSNHGAASRNLAACKADPDSDWLVMLDDDSHPLDGRFIATLRGAPADVGIVTADIYLPAQERREDGGLPEVLVGCGAAIRRELFDKAGGYDATFEYYVEEYDLAARAITLGYRTVFDPHFRVDHYKSPGGRDMNRIVSLLLRNGSWVMQRYAPDADRREQLREVRRRCRLIADLEQARDGYIRGLEAVRATLSTQQRSPMSRLHFDRFTGLWHAREALQRAREHSRFDRVAVVARGKNAWVVDRALAELGVEVVPVEQAEALVIGTMSPGPMLDAMGKFHGRGRVIAPWSTADRVQSRLNEPRP